LLDECNEALSIPASEIGIEEELEKFASTLLSALDFQVDSRSMFLFVLFMPYNYANHDDQCHTSNSKQVTTLTLANDYPHKKI
jgi:hypothetical protein